MRDLNTPPFDETRMRDVEMRLYGCEGNDKCGIFRIRYPGSGADLGVIASSGEGWDHVSVSLPDRVPSYEEMRFIAMVFFKEDEYAMQLHVPSRTHVNVHPYCLHWWRPHDVQIPVPPLNMV